MIALPMAMKGSHIDIGSSSSSISSHLVATPARRPHPFLLLVAPALASLRRIQGFPVRGRTHPVPKDGTAAVVAPRASCPEPPHGPQPPAARTPNSSGSSDTRCHTAG